MIVGIIIGMIIFWLMILSTFFFGMYANGWHIPKEVTEKLIGNIKKIRDDSDIGAVRRPTARDLEKRKNPVLKATEEAMMESLKNIPELADYPTYT